MKILNVLIGCEESAVVREAFRKLGHNAWSCDLLDSAIPGNHFKGDVRNFLTGYAWDIGIFHTPCTFLANSGVQWLYKDRKNKIFDPERMELLKQDAELFKMCMDADIPKIAMENPIPHKYALEIIGRKYDQKIQPWQFGHGESKATCLWLKNLPPLVPTNIVEGREQRIWRMAPGPERQKMRSRTFQGIADAMAAQWGGPVYPRPISMAEAHELALKAMKDAEAQRQSERLAEAEYWKGFEK